MRTIASYFDEFVTLWVVIDPIGTVPIFLSVVGSRSPGELRAIATRACLIAAVVLLMFMGLGQVLLNAIGVSISSFKIAGGLVLFKFALSMIFAHEATSRDRNPGTGSDPAVFPIAIPSIAGPGTILASVLLSDNDRFGFAQQAGTAVTMLVVLFVQWTLLLLAVPIQRRLGTSGTSVLSRIMGIILAALAAETVLGGIRGMLESWGLAK